MASSAGADVGALAWAAVTPPASRLMAVAAATAKVRIDVCTKPSLSVGRSPRWGSVWLVRRQTLPDNLTNCTYQSPTRWLPSPG